jgi:hypothetical protein
MKVRLARAGTILVAGSIGILSSCGWVQEKFQVDSFVHRDEPMSGKSGGPLVKDLDKPGNIIIRPFDLDKGTLLGSTQPASQQAVTDKSARDRLLDHLLYLSDQVCEQHKTRIAANAASMNVTFSGITTLLGAAGAIVTGETAARILAGTAGAASGLQSNINEHFYQNNLALAVNRQIDRQRIAKLREINQSRTKDPSIYSLEGMIRDVAQYHELCSFHAGIAGLTDETKRPATVDELRGKIESVRMQIRANQDTLALMDQRGLKTKPEYRQLEIANGTLGRSLGFLTNQLNVVMTSANSGAFAAETDVLAKSDIPALKIASTRNDVTTWRTRLIKVLDDTPAAGVKKPADAEKTSIATAVAKATGLIDPKLKAFDETDKKDALSYDLIRLEAGLEGISGNDRDTKIGQINKILADARSKILIPLRHLAASYETAFAKAEAEIRAGKYEDAAKTLAGYAPPE